MNFKKSILVSMTAAFLLAGCFGSTDEVEEFSKQREKARRNKDWKKTDELR